MKTTACSGTSRLSKKSLLASMGYGAFSPPPMTDPPLSLQKKEKILEVVEDNGGDLRRASIILGISVSSLRRRIAMWNAPSVPQTAPQSPSSTRRFYESIKNPWSVTSFDPSKREACVEIRTPSATTHLSFDMPSLKFEE